MKRRQIQWLLAAVFFILGGWCLVSPSSVMALTIRPEYRSDAPIATILMGAFGAQAMIAGLFAAFSKFTRTTFLAYGIGLLPFFVFDYWFYVVTPVFTPLGMLDAVGNVIMLGLCWLGWRSKERA
jgi:type IV secretory pathway TrbD component